jgi:glucose-1-phosphate cytidylyltransferase
VKTIILAGGLGTRLSEETDLRPKPMIEIGGKPLLWHLMSLYSAAGYDEFVVAAGYKQEIIKEYFQRFYAFNHDVTVDLKTGETIVRERADRLERWKVHVIDTGLEVGTGGRIKRLREIIGDETFMCTYGDGLASIDIAALVRFHEQAGRIATLTAVRPPARFGALEISGDRIVAFNEKSQAHEGWINGGFFVFGPEIFDYISEDGAMLEQETLGRLAREGRLSCYQHGGFWQPMDTLRDKRHLEALWSGGNAPWIRS